MISYSKLSRTGLGNKIFIWAQGFVFSQVNNCPHITTGWIKLHIGPILRRESSMRFYFGYTNFWNTIESYIYLFFILFQKKTNLSQERCSEKLDKNSVYVFDKVPSSSHYFENLSTFRKQINVALIHYLDNDIHKRVESHKNPSIGVHVRLGDFKVGNLNTPITYYIEQINKLREILGRDLSVTIFTDGSEAEVKNLLQLPKVELAKNDKDIVHLLLLSKSDYIIATTNSTFSQWAGFLSEAPVILDSRIPTSRIRLEQELFEGGIEDFRKIAVNLNLKR